MNGERPSTNMPPHPSPDWVHQCTLYLLGELHGQSLTTFERQVANSPELSEVLVAQAALIDDVSKIEIEPWTTPATTPATTTSVRWKWIATLVSLSACVAVAILSIQYFGQATKPQIQVTQSSSQRQSGSQDTVGASESESLLIAKSWVGDSSVAASENEFFAIFTEDALYEVEDETEVDSVISLMAVAVAAEDDSTDGEANDG